MGDARVVVLVPIKRFDAGKSRLRASLSDAQTVTLARELARGVIEACAPLECRVVCDDDEVARFALECGSTPLRVSAADLNGSISEAYRSITSSLDVVVIAHGDIARPTGLGQLSPGEGVTIFTDRHGTGTNVMALPAAIQFNFAYGTHSARRHEAEARRRGLAVRVVTNSPWGHDIDVPEDLEDP